MNISIYVYFNIFCFIFISRFAEPIFGEGDSAWGDDPEYYNDITKLEAHSVIDASAPPQLGPGQYMAVNGALVRNLSYKIHGIVIPKFCSGNILCICPQNARQIENGHLWAKWYYSWSIMSQ